jgi:hypothetical protein
MSNLTLETVKKLGAKFNQADSGKASQLLFTCWAVTNNWTLKHICSAAKSAGVLSIAEAKNKKELWFALEVELNAAKVI